MKIKCLIVDDEPLAIEVLESYLQNLDTFEIIATCQSAFEAYEWLNKKKIDLVFLDIQMPGMKGTDFIRNMKYPPKVILTTAYREYAIEGFDLDVVDYLLKPISFERFFKAVNKFLHYYSLHHNVTINRRNIEEDEFIYIRANKKINKVFLQKIKYAESIKDYITVHTTTGKITTKYTLTAFEEILPDKNFLRIHRSYIVAIRHINGFTANTVDVSGVELPIGRNYRSQVFRALNFSSPRE
jgi:two-component system LytT family response regulator